MKRQTIFCLLGGLVAGILIGAAATFFMLLPIAKGAAKQLNDAAAQFSADGSELVMVQRELLLYKRTATILNEAVLLLKKSPGYQENKELQDITKQIEERWEIYQISIKVLEKSEAILRSKQ